MGADGRNEQPKTKQGTPRSLGPMMTYTFPPKLPDGRAGSRPALVELLLNKHSDILWGFSTGRKGGGDFPSGVVLWADQSSPNWNGPAPGHAKSYISTLLC